jgi:hypothetical protein
MWPGPARPRLETPARTEEIIMHPDITTVIARQHTAELTAQARSFRLARQARAARRAARAEAAAARPGRARQARDFTLAR